MLPDLGCKEQKASYPVLACTGEVFLAQHQEQHCCVVLHLMVMAIIRTMHSNFFFPKYVIPKH
jgi:hypothetical protein